MSKFKAGDKIRRVSRFESYAPKGFETTVEEDYKCKDADGEKQYVIDAYWELAEDKSKWHKHHDVIVAWAKGAKIECKPSFPTYEDWESTPQPFWDEEVEYRIKPAPKTDKERIEELEKRVKELEQAK